MFFIDYDISIIYVTKKKLVQGQRIPDNSMLLFQLKGTQPLKRQTKFLLDRYHSCQLMIDFSKSIHLIFQKQLAIQRIKSFQRSTSIIIACFPSSGPSPEYFEDPYVGLNIRKEIWRQSLKNMASSELRYLYERNFQRLYVTNFEAF